MINIFKNWLVVVVLLGIGSAAVFKKVVNLGNTVETFTVTYQTPFGSTPAFAYYIEGGQMTASQFAVTHNPALTAVSTTQITISFVLHVAAVSTGDGILLTLLVTDENPLQFSIGMLEFDVANERITLTGIDRNIPHTLSVYPLFLPMFYDYPYNQTALQLNLVTNTTPTASLYTQGTAYFSFIYISNVFSSQKVGTLFPSINHVYYGYLIQYARFSYTPSETTTMLAVKKFESATAPFMALSAYKDFTSSGAAVDSFIMGYIPMTGAVYSADLFLFNTTQACGSQQYLYYYMFFWTLPRACYPCHPTCQTCIVPNITLSNQTDSSSCLSCSYLRYLQPTNGIYGTCPCYKGLQQLNGVCQPCEQGCLTFNVVYIQSTNQTNFILYYSYPDIDQQMALITNMEVFINGVKTDYEANQRRQAIYELVVPLSQLQVCEHAPCTILFLMTHPQKVMTSDHQRTLSHNNVSMVIEDYVNYYTIVPQELQQAFVVLGMVVAGSYGAGLTTFVKMLFEMEQMIDFHKYINLTMPVIFNQLVEGLSSFKFLDLTLLFPDEAVNKLKNFPPNDLDQMGPPKLMYYEQGVNYIKNIIGGILSCIIMLGFNYIVYFILKKTPLKITKKLAKKINKRKIITIHDTFQQLVLPMFFFAGTQLFYILPRPSLSWIYCIAGGSAALVLAAPFLVVLYVYQNRGRQQMIDVYEDLLQDNDMSQPVTYIYYIFNYYRKVFFAVCLTSTIPGLVQIYSFMTFNVVYLAFQVYLIVGGIYRSKSKVIIKFLGGVLMVVLQGLIVVYNTNNYGNQANVNIGMVCFYIAIATAILGIIDAVIKIIDTIQQEVDSKKIKTQKQVVKQILKQFRNQIVCNLGQDITHKKDPKIVKFRLDKQLMQNTIRPRQEEEESSQRLSAADATGENINVDLVYIDDEWENVYPQKKEENELVFQFDEEDEQYGQRNRDKEKQDKNQVEMYPIPAEINREAQIIAKRRMNNSLKRKSSKYDIHDQPAYQSLASRSSTRTRIHDARAHLQVRPIDQAQEEVSQYDSSRQ